MRRRCVTFVKLNNRRQADHLWPHQNDLPYFQLLSRLRIYHPVVIIFRLAHSSRLIPWRRRTAGCSFTLDVRGVWRVQPVADFNEIMPNPIPSLSRTESLHQMAYSAEWDGYDREWHKTFAQNRRELDVLVRGASQAEREIKKLNESP